MNHIIISALPSILKGFGVTIKQSDIDSLTEKLHHFADRFIEMERKIDVIYRDIPNE